jgi:uncharacterized protein
MLVLISPAKTLDYSSPLPSRKATRPRFLDEAVQLNGILKDYSPVRLQKLQAISQELAELNASRNQQWSPPFTLANARQALFAFKGDVYLGLEAWTFSPEDLAWAQDHLRILSGLYGLLRPLDLIQPYRLEMGTALPNPQGKNLYQFWGDKPTALLLKEQRAGGHRALINLASQEYFAAVQPALLPVPVLTPVFKDYKNGSYKILSFFAKKARGRMAAWLLKQRVEEPEALRDFAEDGYRYDSALSSTSELVFTRRAE